MIAETEQLVQEPVGSLAAVAVVACVAAAECVACGVPGVAASVGVGPDVMELAEAGPERGAGEELVRFEKRAEIVPGQTAIGMAAQVVVVVVAAADEPAPGATAWTAEADGFAETVVDITVLGSWGS